MTQRKGLRGILALLCAMTLLIGAIGPAWATEAAVPESAPTAAAPENTPVAQTPKGVIASWQWVDPNGYVKAGALELPTGEGPVDYSGVTVMLPTAITASVDGKDGVNISVVNWLCNEFTAPATSGEFTFKAEIAQDYTLGENVPALEVKVKLIPQQPVADAPADTTGDTTTDTTGNTTAPTDSTPPAADVVTVENWTWVDSMQALSDDGKLHLKEEITDANLPDGYALEEGAAPLAVAVVVEQVTMLPAGNDRPYSLYVGNTDVAKTEYSDNAAYWTSSDGGTNWTSQLDKPTADSYIHYDGNGTLTLHNVNISSSNENGIYAEAMSGSAVSLTIELEEENKVSGASGIYVFSKFGDASLSISGTGSLTTEGTGGGSFSGIQVQSNDGKAELTINNVDVTATNNVAQGIILRSGGSSTASLTVNGGKLTASGSDAGIKYVFGSSATGNGTPTVTVSGNAIVRANGGISDDSSTDIQIGADSSASSGGIVFDGKNGTVYGDVTLQEDITIGEGESLTIPENASLTTNDKLIVNGGTVNGNPTGNVTYLVTGVTLDKNQLTLLPGESADLQATVTPESATTKDVTWSSSDDTVAAVDKGTVKALKAGTATITAKTADGSGKSASCTVTVNSGISANPAALDFGSVATNYSAAPKAQTVTITNNTSGKVTLTQPAASAKYDIGALSKTELDSKETATFTVQPKTGLLQGEYQETIKVSSTAGDVSFDVSFNVVQLKLSFQNYTGKTYDGKAMANPTKDQLTVTGADFSEVTFTWYKDAEAEENKLTSAPTDAGTYVLVAAVAKTDSHGEAKAQQTITIAKADATDAMKKAEGTMIKNHESSLTLPTLPDGASYGTPTGNGTYVTDLRVNDGKLAYKGTSNVVNGGKYEVQVPVTGAKNYKEYSIVVTLTGEEKLPVTLTAANFTTTYNGSEVFPEAIHKTATYDGQAVNGTWSFVGGNPKNAGTYKDIELKFTPKDAEKYAEASIKLDVVIKKAPLKVSVKLSKTKIAVNSKLPTVSLSYIGLVGNEKLDPDVEPKFEGMPSGKKTGTYTIKLKNVDEVKEAINALPASENYDITYVTSAKLSVVSGNNPLTADTSNIGMWTAIMIISGIGLIVVLVVMVVLNKKSKRRRPRYRRTPPKQED